MRKNKKIKRKELIFSEAEWQIIEERAAAINVKTSVLLKRLCLEDRIVYIDTKAIAGLESAMRSIGNNINQMARKLNETNNCYASDMENFRKEYQDLCLILNRYVYTLQ